MSSSFTVKVFKTREEFLEYMRTTYGTEKLEKLEEKPEEPWEKFKKHMIAGASKQAWFESIADHEWKHWHALSYHDQTASSNEMREQWKIMTEAYICMLKKQYDPKVGVVEFLLILDKIVKGEEACEKLKAMMDNDECTKL